MSSAATTALKKAVRGLLFPSEKDAPFAVRTLKTDVNVTKTRVAALVGQPEDAEVEELPFVKFFEAYTQIRKWHAEDDKAVVKRYQDLVATVRAHLREVKVFKIGRVRLKVVVVGKTAEGTWLALETDALET